MPHLISIRTNGRGGPRGALTVTAALTAVTGMTATTHPTTYVTTRTITRTITRPGASAAPRLG